MPPERHRSMPIKQRLSLALRALRGYSAPGQGGFVRTERRELPAITPEEVSQARLFFLREKFFIFGHARSGTTLLTRLVRLHPQVHCNYQAHFFTRPPLLESLVATPEIGEWLSRRSNRWNHGRDLSALVLRAAADFILESEAHSLGKSIVGDKSPNSLNDGEAVRLMHKVYPDGRLIYIVRDGRDTAISHRIQSFIEFPERLGAQDARIRADFFANPEPYLRGERSIFTEKAIRQAAEGWARNVAETEREGQRLFNGFQPNAEMAEPHYLSLRYEDLLSQPWEEMTRLWAFLGASSPDEKLREDLLAEMQQNPDADWQEQKASDALGGTGIAQPLLKGRRGSWKTIFSRRDREIFQEIAGEILAQWGYESTNEEALT